MSARITPFTAADRDWLVARHGALYAEAEGFDDTFAPLVKDILDAFLADHDPAVEAGWIARDGDTRLGSIFCMRGDVPGAAKLRLFLVEPLARGTGIGRRLLDRMMTFAQDAGYDRIRLWTHESHRAACALYVRAGFACTASRPVRSFGQDLVEQTWEIALGPPAPLASGGARV